MDTLGDALPDEIERVKKLMPHYLEIGPPGIFTHVMMREAVEEAREAIAQNDVVAMLRAYNSLKGFTS